MIPDVQIPGTDGWYMQELYTELKARWPRLTRLENYRRGTPPMPMGSTDLLKAFYKVQQMARTAVGDLVVQALIERLAVRTIRTAATGDDDGDVQATRMWNASGMPVGQSDVFRMLATFGECCTSTCAPDSEDGWSRIAAEDPRECIVMYDAYDQPIAALKIKRDRLFRFDYVVLYRPGRKVVAVRTKSSKREIYNERSDRALDLPRFSFTPGAFTILPALEATGARPAELPVALGNLSDSEMDALMWSETYSEQDLPIVRHVAPDGVGVFERHTDLIDRVNHVVLQSIVIATLQAFRQRGIEFPNGGADGQASGLPKYDADGVEIDWNDVFAADPGALWRLPVGAKIWESGQVDMTGILKQAEDALKWFAAMTRTPFSMFTSDAVNQSAQGAQLSREGLIFKVEDYQRIETQALLCSIAIGFKYMPDSIRFAPGDEGEVSDRADLAGMTIDWLPAERYSLAERTLADSQSSLPRRQKFARFYNMTPGEVDIAMGQLAEDAMLDAIPKPQLPEIPAPDEASPADEDEQDDGTAAVA